METSKIFFQDVRSSVKKHNSKGYAAGIRMFKHKGFDGQK